MKIYSTGDLVVSNFRPYEIGEILYNDDEGQWVVSYFDGVEYYSIYDMKPYETKGNNRKRSTKTTPRRL